MNASFANIVPVLIPLFLLQIPRIRFENNVYILVHTSSIRLVAPIHQEPSSSYVGYVYTHEHDFVLSNKRVTDPINMLQMMM
jgi:hypothetical protein